MGTGQTWFEFCEGRTDDYPSETAIAFCETTLMAYQIGAVEQAKEFGKTPSLCSRTLPPTLNEKFVVWIKEDPERLNEEFSRLYPEFLKAMNECEVQESAPDEDSQ